MLPWTGAAFFRMLSCTTADVLWFRARSITPLCLRKSLVYGSIFCLVGFLWGLCLFIYLFGGLFWFFSGKVNFLNICKYLFSKKNSVSQSSIVQIQAYKGKLQFFKTTHPIQDPAGITFFSSLEHGFFNKRVGGV